MTTKIKIHLKPSYCFTIILRQLKERTSSLKSVLDGAYTYQFLGVSNQDQETCPICWTINPRIDGLKHWRQYVEENLEFGTYGYHGVIDSPCRHTYCVPCIEQLISHHNTHPLALLCEYPCPLCRSDISCLFQFYVMSPHHKGYPQYMEVLKGTLKSSLVNPEIDQLVNLGVERHNIMLF